LSKKILLVYTINYKQWPHVPNSVLALAGSLLKQDFAVEILDTALEDYRDVNYIDYFLVGISSLSDVSIKTGLDVAKHIKAVSQNIGVAWGGAHASALPDQTLKNEYVDFVVRGHGEDTIVELARALSTNCGFEDIKGLSYKSNSQIVHNDDRGPVCLDTQERYPYHLLDISRYPSVHEKFSYISSRGCPYQCTFCSYEKSWVARSSELVLDDIEWITNQYKPGVIRFSDPEFFVNEQRVRDICKGLIKRSLKIKWEAACRINYFAKYTDEFIGLLIDSGCYQLAFGGESGSDKILAQINKKITRAQIEFVTRRSRQFNIDEIRVSFMGGFPGETNDDIHQTLSLIQSMWKINPDIYINGYFIYMPYPGSQLYLEAQQKYGLVPPASLEEWGEIHGLNEHTNRMTPWISKNTRNKLETISSMVRFHYFRQYFSRMSKKQQRSWFYGSRLLAWLFKIMNCFYRCSKAIRWKYKLFSFAFEWKIWIKLRDHFLGQH
jgi:radical SAM superfamily enzyme YgiQ (UPF0313 family)